MKRLTLKLTTEELKLLTALAADQLFHQEFIDPRMPGHQTHRDQLNLGKALVGRMRLLATPMQFNQLVPQPLTLTMVYARAPTFSGIYGISNAREWIYIGETDNIRGALIAQLKGSSPSVMQKQPTGFVFEVCDQAKRLARQDRLVYEYEPRCNRPSKGSV